MTVEEAKRRVCEKMDRDAKYAREVQEAIEAEDEATLRRLVWNVIGFVVDIARAILDWLRG